MTEKFVHEVADALRLKYGLEDNPSPSAIEEWSVTTAALIAEGVPAEEAGRRAAAAKFGPVDRILYFSESETLAALLARVREK